MAVNLRALIGKLNHATRSAVESAAGLCLSRTHYDVEIEHYLMKLLDQTDGDFAAILKQYGIDRSRLASELSKSLDHLKTGNGRTPAMSPHIATMLQEGWTVGSLDYGAAQVRTGHTIIALLANDDLARLVKDVSRELTKIPLETLKRDFAAITGDSAEESTAQYASSGGASSAPSASGDAPRPGGGKTPNLDAYTVNLTERAKQGKIDRVLGRDFEIRQCVDILLRRRQNNPILVGEAGVGKTAVVEGFAQRIVDGEVPPPLQNVTVRSLDLALLQAGAGVKGEFENRLKGLIEEAKNSPTPIILFIDEAHTMIGAGGTAGQNDAANLLKPALARGELRTLAATTWSEYKKYFEKDPALARRFQLVKVEEPSEDVCLQMMRGVLPSLEKHHNVRILDSGLDAAVRLSHRYLADRQLPDKAVSILDTACARLALGQSATPPSIEAATRRIDDLAVQKRVLEREVAVGVNHTDRLAEIENERVATEAELARLTERFDKEKALVTEIRDLRQKLEAHHAGDAKQDGADAMRARLTQLDRDLETLQGEAPLIRVCVDGSIVGEVLSGWTGIPVGKMMSDEMKTMLELENHLGARVIGQGTALEQISRRVRTSKAGIEDPQKPKGVFMLVGPSGVGKTETALALADLLYGGEQNLITINMSEFQEAHTVSTLKGSPGIRRLRRRRRPHRSGAPSPVFGRAPGRSRKGAPRRPRALLPGLRQGAHGRRRRPRDRFQEHDHHPHDERRHRHHHVVDGRSGDDAVGRRVGEGPQAGARQDVQTRVPRPHGHHPVFPGARRESQADRSSQAREGEPSHRRDAQGAHGVRRRGGRGRGGPLHRSRKWRAQRRQHPHEHAAAGDLDPPARADGDR